MRGFKKVYPTTTYPKLTYPIVTYPTLTYTTPTYPTSIVISMINHFNNQKYFQHAKINTTSTIPTTTKLTISNNSNTN